MYTVARVVLLIVSTLAFFGGLQDFNRATIERDRDADLCLVTGSLMTGFAISNFFWLIRPRNKIAIGGRAFITGLTLIVVVMAVGYFVYSSATGAKDFYGVGGLALICIAGFGSLLLALDAILWQGWRARRHAAGKIARRKVVSESRPRTG